MSGSSLTPVVTGATVVFRDDPVIRFQRSIDIEIGVRDLERRVQRLARQLAPTPQHGLPPDRRSRRSGW